jgi:anthranilate phosphoribosyltransferase
MVVRINPSFSPEHIRFLSYIKAVGTGPKGNRPLSREEAKDAFGLIIKKLIPDTLIGAFLLGWRVQGESEEELSGCVEYLAEQSTGYCARAHCRSKPSVNIASRDFIPAALSSIEIGYPMDGKTKFFPIMLKAAQHLTDVEIHAVYDVPLGPKYGSTLNEFQVTAPNLTLHHRRELLEGLSNLTGLRNDIGIRTAFNTLEKLNFLAPTALIGMHHAPYFDLYATLYAPYYQRLVIVQGHEGTPEILKKIKYKIVENGETTSHSIDPEEFGIEPIVTKDEMTLEEMVALMKNPNENLAKMVRLNAAFLGFVSGKYQTIQKGYTCLQD